MIIDFMGYARKVLTKKGNLKLSLIHITTCGQHLCNYRSTTTHGLMSPSTRTMIKVSKALRVVEEKSRQISLSRWSELTNYFLLKSKSFGPFQKTKYHSNSFSLNGFRQTAVIIKVCTLEDRIKKMETSAYWYPMLKKKSQKEP